MENTLLIKINKSYKSDITEDQLKEVTSKSWKVSLDPTSTRNIKYYCAVYQKKIIEVYELLGYEADKHPEKNGRYILNGKKADEEIRKQLINKDVSQIHKGSGNPIKYTSLETLLNEKELINANPIKSSTLDETDIIFMSDKNQEEIIDLLEYKKNIILQGAPGVGKTYIAEHIVKKNFHVTDAQILQVQFHQSYSYEDFIEGYRPNKEGKFELQPGLFKSFVDIAQEDSALEKPYFLIIDEINRGNLSKIFGELFMLIEKDKRGKFLKLTYSKKDFTVPKNLYIIGTMNTADRSLDEIDFALRRRFSFIYLESAFSNSSTSKKIKSFLKEAKVENKNIDFLLNKIFSLNKSIREDYRLGKGFEIGHAYFTNLSGIENFEKWYQNIIKFEIKPLLEEYYFDNNETLSLLLKDLKYEI